MSLLAPHVKNDHPLGARNIRSHPRPAAAEDSAQLGDMFQTPRVAAQAPQKNRIGRIRDSESINIFRRQNDGLLLAGTAAVTKRQTAEWQSAIT